jgi:hypothetical protein
MWAVVFDHIARGGLVQHYMTGMSVKLAHQANKTRLPAG